MRCERCGSDLDNTMTVDFNRPVYVFDIHVHTDKELKTIIAACQKELERRKTI